MSGRSASTKNRHVVDDDSFYDANSEPLSPLLSVGVAASAELEADEGGVTTQDEPDTPPTKNTSGLHFSPQAPPPANAPPPPPPPAGQQQQDDEAHAAIHHPHPQFAAQERFHPETSLPPTHLSYNEIPQHYQTPQQQQSSSSYPVHIFMKDNHALSSPSHLQPQHSQSSPSIPLHKVRQAEDDHPLANILAQPSLASETSPATHQRQSSETHLPEESPTALLQRLQQQRSSSEAFHSALMTQPRPSYSNSQQFTTTTQEIQQPPPNSDESVSSQLQNVDLQSHAGSSQHTGSSSNHTPRPTSSFPQSYQHQQEEEEEAPNNVVRIVPVPKPPTQPSDNQGDSLNNSNHNDNNSYQQPFAYPQNGDEGSTAFVVHYEDETDTPQPNNARPSGGGDATLSPNVGLTNSYDYALWGMAPHELLRFLQHMDAAAGLGSLVIASLSWFGKLLFLQLAQVVLLAYLAAFSAVLVVVEVMAIVTPEQQRLIPTNVMGRIRDQLGFLFHPWGKAFFILLLTTMCWGVGGLFLGILGSVYLVSAIGWFYAACAYRQDLPRLMGSIDDTFRAEARRRNSHAPRFSIATWGAIMQGVLEDTITTNAAQQTWTRLHRGHEERPQQEEAADDQEAGERTSLLSSQQ